ncbi:hypothetical protein BDY19DRAFT_974728, partial [Irpex rosettiformis]
MMSIPTSSPILNNRSSTSTGLSQTLSSDDREVVDISSNNSGDSADSSESSPNHLPDILDSADDFALEHNPETTLGEIVDSLIKLADEDHLQASTEQVPADSAVDKAGTGTELDVEPEISSTPNSPAPNAGIYEGNGLPFRLDIADLFNFSESYWVSVIEKQAESGLADEAELCELLVNMERILVCIQAC